MIAFALVLVVIGAVLLILSSPRKGGNVKIQYGETKAIFPEITGWGKIPSFIFGLVCIGLGIWIGVSVFVQSFDLPTTPPTISTLTNTTSPTETPVPPILASTSAPSPIPTDTPTPSFTPTPECRFNNLLDCSTRVPFPEGNFYAANLINGKLFLNFNNQQIGSGLAFQFKPPLNVQGFISLELISTSTQGFTFEVEYKADKGSGLNKVETSAPQFFPIASNLITFSIPITYDGEIDEIVINFFEVGESSNLIIDSIRLK